VNLLDTWRGAMDRALGLDLQAHDLHFSHMAARALVVFCVAVLLARVADRRFMGRSACFDFMLGVILGSVLSRGINGQAPFFPTLGASALLVIFHRVVGTAAFHSHWFSELVKGRERVLVRNGRLDEDAMRRNKISYDDLCENLRLNGNVIDLSEVREARLERNGSISVIHAERRS
jgi:uncharacterized membrane protein YcaP (DUF421 family)